MAFDAASTRRGCKPEALVEREVLLAVGRVPGLLIAKNESGFGHPHAVKFAMEKALKPFGPTVVATALSVLAAHTIRWGLGTGSPDLVGSLQLAPGQRPLALGWELKAEDGTVSPDQTRWHRGAATKGLEVEVIRNVDEAWAALERMGVRR